jgi:hypothetical protein
VSKAYIEGDRPKEYHEVKIKLADYYGPPVKLQIKTNADEGNLAGRDPGVMPYEYLFQRGEVITMVIED